MVYGSLIGDAGELDAVTVERIPSKTPFAVEYARKSRTRAGGPTLVPVVGGGAQVRGFVLVIDQGVSVSSAADMLYRREIHQPGTAVRYVHRDNPGSDAVVIERLKDFESCDLVLYTMIGANIHPLTAAELARLAIKSAKSAAGEANNDGISYLISAMRNGIITPLTSEYASEVLAITRTKSLDKAWAVCREAAGSKPRQPQD